MKKEYFILMGFVLIKFIFQFTLISPEYELHRDEFLYLDQGKHLDWGYLSVPPFTSWLSYLIYKLGSAVFWVKFFPALFGALTMVVVWKTIEFFKGNLFALILGSLCVLFSVILRINTLYQPNSFDILSWTFIYYAVIRYIDEYDPKWAIIAGISFGMAFLNKYNIAFLALGLLPAILLSTHRKIFLRKEIYIGISIALLLIAPNLLWQIKNDFPVVRHLNELADTQLVNVDRLEFLKSQILFFIGSWLVILSGFYSLLYFQGFKKYRFFFSGFIFTMAIFMLLRAKDYYAIGVYPIYIGFGAVYLSKIIKFKRRKILYPLLLSIPIVLFIPLFLIAFPNRSPEYIKEHSENYKDFGLLRWEDGQDHEIPQDFADMLGWKELAKKVDSIYSQLPNKEQTLILCDNYGQSGAINYYSTLKIEAVSFNADYINWFNLDKKYVNLIRVKEYDPSEDELSETLPYFETGDMVGSITNPLAREYKTEIYLFKNSKIDVNDRIREEIKEKSK